MLQPVNDLHQGRLAVIDVSGGAERDVEHELMPLLWSYTNPKRKRGRPPEHQPEA